MSKIVATPPDSVPGSVNASEQQQLVDAIVVAMKGALTGLTRTELQSLLCRLDSATGIRQTDSGILIASPRPSGGIALSFDPIYERFGRENVRHIPHEEGCTFMLLGGGFIQISHATGGWTFSSSNNIECRFLTLKHGINHYLDQDGF